MESDYHGRRSGIGCQLRAGLRRRGRERVIADVINGRGLEDGMAVAAFSQTDFTEDLKKITVPVLVMHGDDDQIVPYADSAPLSAKLLKNGTLKTYKGFPHGMPTTEADTINADLLAFLKA